MEKTPGNIKRIALLGPESTGKTTLCMRLAAHFQTRWVHEFARDYIALLGRPYTLEDVVTCARGQLQLENREAALSNEFLFCDTEFILLKTWCLDVFGTCPDWIAAMAATHRYELYLLTAPDLPFQPDPVRENPHRRQELFDIYEAELQGHGFPYVVVSGTGDPRFTNALSAVENLHLKT